MERPRAIQISLRFILCWVGSMAIGYTVFGGAIFHREFAVFQFVATGAIAGAAVAFAARNRTKRMLAVFVVGVLATVVLAESSTPARLLRDIVGVAAIILAVQSGLRWDRVFPRVAIGKFVLWAAGFGLVQAAAVGLLALVLAVPLDLHTLLYAIRIGVLIGAGVGFGYEVSEIVVGRLNRDGRMLCASPRS